MFNVINKSNHYSKPIRKVLKVLFELGNVENVRTILASFKNFPTKIRQKCWTNIQNS